MDSKREQFFEDVALEVERAYRKHGRLKWGRHELFAVLLEEVEETIEAFRFRFFLPKKMQHLWVNIRHDRPQEELRKEIIQVAAVCLRYLETGDRYSKPNGERLQRGEAVSRRLREAIRSYRAEHIKDPSMFELSHADLADFRFYLLDMFGPSFYREGMNTETRFCGVPTIGVNEITPGMVRVK